MFKGLGIVLKPHRELRFTNVNLHFFNKSFGEVIEFAIHQNQGHHYLSSKIKFESLKPEFVS